jgi:hypothetical protein
MKTEIVPNRSDRVISHTLLPSRFRCPAPAFLIPKPAPSVLSSYGRIAAITFSLLFSPVVFSADPPITTAELARHLGISTWRIPEGDLPDTYTVILHHLKDGKLTKDYILGKFKKHGDLLICTRWLAESASVSVDDGNTIVSTKAALSSRPIFATENKFQGLGIPLLLCYRDPAAANVDERHKESVAAARSMDYSKVASGLAIVITQSNP